MKKIIPICLFAALFLFIGKSDAQQNLKLGANLQYSLPQGDFGDLYNNAFGGNVIGVYDLSESFDLSLSLGYESYSFDNSSVGGGSNIDASISDIPLLVGARYYFTDANFRPYGTVEIGPHFLSASVGSVSASSTKFGYGIGVGFNLPLNQKILLDVAAKFNGNGLEVSQKTTTTTTGSGYYSSSSSSSSSTVTYFSISAGVLFRL